MRSRRRSAASIRSMCARCLRYPARRRTRRRRTLHNAARYRSQRMVEENFDFYGRALWGGQQRRPRWRRFVSYADRDLGEALGQAYVDRAFPPQSAERVKKLVDSLETALGED